MEEDGDPEDFYTFVHGFGSFSNDFEEAFISEEDPAAFADRLGVALRKADRNNGFTFNLLFSTHN